MKELVKLIAEHLVDYPDQVKVTELNAHSSSIIELIVAKEDIGKIIGRQGRTADSIRTLIKAAGAKTKRRITLEIVG